jgi:hypothetical protein
MIKNDLLLAQIFACMFMTGLIWLVQIVHYPSFRFISTIEFSKFESFHASKISWLVIPAMLIELFAALFLFAENSGSWLNRWNILSVILVWASTFFLSAPLHSQLAVGFSATAIDRLVLTNWPRTILWSARSAVFFQYLRIKLL